MKIKYAIILVLVLIVVGAGIGLKMFFKPHADISKLDAEYKVEATAIMDEFQKDENAATLKYSEKPIEINGKLVAKNKLPNGTDLLVLENEMEGISCQLDSNWAAANPQVIQALETGSQVTVKGVCKGFLMEIKVSPAVVVSK
ncbi:MAG: hypothetical protein Q8N05_14815 [Bacteroidota bacterium]|nr:hypothetical protein [Bacteroidota bacterium]